MLTTTLASTDAITASSAQQYARTRTPTPGVQSQHTTSPACLRWYTNELLSQQACCQATFSGYCCYSWSWQPATFRTQSLLRHALNMVLSINLLHFLQWWPMLNAKAFCIIVVGPHARACAHQPDPLAEHPASFGLGPASTYSLIRFWHMLACSCAKSIPYVPGHKPPLYDSGQYTRHGMSHHRPYTYTNNILVVLV